MKRPPKSEAVRSANALDELHSFIKHYYLQAEHVCLLFKVANITDSNDEIVAECIGITVYEYGVSYYKFPVDTELAPFIRAHRRRCMSLQEDEIIHYAGTAYSCYHELVFYETHNYMSSLHELATGSKTPVNLPSPDGDPTKSGIPQAMIVNIQQGDTLSNIIQLGDDYKGLFEDRLSEFQARLDSEYSGVSLGVHGPPDQRQADAIRTASGTPPKVTVNQRMVATISKNHESMGWNSRQWAAHLKCGKSTVVETAVWKSLEKSRQDAKAERMKDRRRRSKGRGSDGE